MLPFPAPTPDAEPLTGAEVTALEDFLHGRLARVLMPRPATLPTCARYGHLPSACWRAGALRCFRCSRCGEETPP